MTDARLILRDRLDDVEARVQRACTRAGRDRADVTLVAVTKTVSVEVAALLPELGVLDLGESRPQELWRKSSLLGGDVRWHLVGHLQRNKIERTMPLVSLLHSLDSSRLFSALEEWCTRQQSTANVLLEVNASREPNKHGFKPEEVTAFLDEILSTNHVHVRGLMTMAAYQEEPERCRPTFAELRRLRDDLRGKVRPPHDLAHLSMGMSNDFEVAIEEGATIIRIGTALFEGLEEA